MAYHGGMSKTASEAEEEVRDLDDLLSDIDYEPEYSLCDSDFGHSPEWIDLRQGFRSGATIGYGG